MAHSSTSIPLSASAVVLVIMVVSAIAAAAAPPPSPVPPMIGMLGCDTCCGDISVPYPFGMGSPHGYHSPGFNLTCDRGTDLPRLLLGDGTLQVMEDIQIESTGVFVMHTSGGGDIEIDADGKGAFGGLSGPDCPYMLSGRNELILMGCNVQATLKNAVNHATISSCSSLCDDGPSGYNVALVSSSSYRSLREKQPLPCSRTAKKSLPSDDTNTQGKE